MNYLEKLIDLGFEFNVNSEREPILQKLSNLEKVFGIELPIFYKEVTSFIAGQHPDVEFSIPVAAKSNYFGEKNEVSFINFINPMSIDWDSLEKQWMEYSNRMPFEIVPIINSDGGDFIYLGVEGGYKGKTYYWVRDLEVNEKFENNNWKAVFLIAQSFEDFFNSIIIEEG